MLLNSFILALSVEHPFLLADNRHYTFYVWRYLFRMNPYVRYLLVPGYYVAFCIVGITLEAQPAVWLLGYAAAVALTLVPSPLLEFRYFVVPYALLRVHARPPPARRLARELAALVALDAAVLALFLLAPFEWAHEPGVPQRFMF
ncbi:hypothetical protein HK405_015514 [Cladochytrium tenue]|nr:hypothetical protein HK405_015514 [Cladochytrium tenue]